MILPLHNCYSKHDLTDAKLTHTWYFMLNKSLWHRIEVSTFVSVKIVYVISNCYAKAVYINNEKKYVCQPKSMTFLPRNFRFVEVFKGYGSIVWTMTLCPTKGKPKELHLNEWRAFTDLSSLSGRIWIRISYCVEDPWALFSTMFWV